MNDKFLSLLGLVKKAGRITLGYDKTINALHTGKSSVVFIAKDLSKGTKRGLLLAAEEKKIPVLSTKYDMFNLSNAVGSKTGIISINDSGFAAALLKLHTNEQTDI